MARGTVVGEGVVSQAATEEYRSGHERVFGDAKVQRGRWIYDPTLGKCVRADEYVPQEARALDAPILAGREYEGVRLTDGTIVNSRRQYEDHLRAKGLANSSDFSPAYYEGVKRERAAEESRQVDRAVHEFVQRVADIPQARYERDIAAPLRRRR